MLNLRLLQNLIRRRCVHAPLKRLFHPEFKDQHPPLQQSANTTNAVQQKYKVFRDADATEIFDVEEEKERYRYQQQDIVQPMPHEDYLDLNLARGIHGVFDIEDLVEVLRKENAVDIFVCSVPREMKYVDYMVVCSGRSYRHMLATAEYVRHMYKIKRAKNDILPNIEGNKSRDWMALDLGNIALHIFSPKAREIFDLESLWAVGPGYDRECNKPEDPLSEMFERHSVLLNDHINKET